MKKKNTPEKFIEIKEATKEENKNDELFCLGLFAQNLEKIGITTALEKKTIYKYSNRARCYQYKFTIYQIE